MSGGEDDARIGRIVAGRYRILRRLGEGGMGVVYEADDGGRRVALKCVHPHHKSQKEVVARFEREARAAAAAGNPHIVEVLDSGRLVDGTSFIALELLEGKDLAAVIAQEGPLTVGRAVRIARQICDALEVAHAKGVIHRDLKPENVFLVERGGDRDFVKVLDFGISKVIDAADGHVTAMTRTGTTVGTPYYMAPEQAQARKDIDHRVDVYALGVILFRTLTGQHPFDDESYPMLVLKICTEAPPPVRRYRPDVPEALEAAIGEMLAKDPAQRFASTREAREALAPFVGLDTPPVLTDAPGTRTTRATALSGDGRVDSPLARAETEALPGWQSGPLAAAPPRDEDDDDPPVPAGVPSPRAGNAMRWVLLAAAVSTVGLLAAMALTMERDEPIERDAELPEPGPPRTKALVAPGAGGLGWTWMNPLPRAMPSFYDVDVAGTDLVAMVGFGGEAVRFAGGTMLRWHSGTDASLYGVAWSSPREAIAVGDRGEIRLLRLEGEPQRVPSGTEVALRSVTVTSATEAWITGDGGALLRMNAYEVSPLESGTDADLLAAHLRGQTLWVAGERGTVLRVEGDRVTPETSGTEVTLRAIGGCGDGNLYAGGDEGRLLRRRADGRWEILEHDHREPWAAIACDTAHGRAVAVGLRGGVLLIAGKRTVRLSSGTDRSLHGVSSARGAPTWVVGDGGRLMQVMDDHVRTLTAGPTGAIQDVGTIGGALVAVGEWGRILREQRHGFEEARSPTKSALAAVAPLGEDRLLAAGDYGALVSIRWDAAELLESPPGSSWRDLVSDRRVVLGVGTEGGVLRGAPGAFEVTRVADAGTFWGVSGTPADAVAVGDEGIVVRIDGRGVRRVPCDVGVGLRGVVETPSGTWAVGEQGVIIRIESAGCVVERPPDRQNALLNGIGLGPNGTPLAVGNRGVALERDAGGRWQPVELDVAGNNLRSVFRTDRDAFIVGAGGVVLRHVRLDN